MTVSGTSWLSAARAVDAAPDDLVAAHLPAGAVVVESLARRGARAVFDGASGPGGGAVLAGFGEAARVVGSGDARWDRIEAGTRELFASVRGPAADDVRLLGGVAFAPARPGAPGDGLGDAVFVLPRWTWIEDARGPRALLCVRQRELSDGGALQAEALELFRGATAQPARSPRPVATSVDDGTDAFVRRVDAACAAIDRGTLEKVVVGRRVELELGGPADVGRTWSELCAREPGTMRLLWRDAGSTLLAASPERLVVRDGGRVVIDALAGTVPRTDDDAAAIAGLLASDKDRREHGVVVAAIALAIAEAGGVARFAETPVPRTLRALHHLATEIEASFDAAPGILALVRRLHPTPAVSGAPSAAAATFLREHEASRGWFTGAFGWLDASGNGAFAVILRALILHGSRAHLFAGTGIVRGSEASRELAETEAKLKAARGALGLETALELETALGLEAAS